MIVHRSPADLRPHPLTECLHNLSDTDPRFTALVDAMIERGFDADKPQTIDGHNRILDGRHRNRAARLAGIKQVPCIVVAEELAATVILDSIVARKHFTKSALAFECYPLFKQAHDEAKARNYERLKSSTKESTSDAIGSWQFPKKTEDLARQLGISRDLFDQAAKVHKHFENERQFTFNEEPEPLTLRQYFEPRIFESEGMGLGEVLKGIGYMTSGSHDPHDSPKRNTRLALFESAWLKVGKQAARWDDFSEPERQKAARVIKEAVLAMPDELRDGLGKALAASRRASTKGEA